jgi:hypothetical protein
MLGTHKVNVSLIKCFCHFVLKQEKRIFTNLHRQLFCWIDKWIDLTMEDIRRMEDETQKELETVSLAAAAVSVSKSVHA